MITKRITSRLRYIVYRMKGLPKRRRNYRLYRKRYKEAVTAIRDIRAAYGPESMPMIPGTAIQFYEWKHHGIKRELCNIIHYMGGSNLVGEKNTLIMVCEKRRVRVFYENIALLEYEYANAAKYLEHLVNEDLKQADETMLCAWLAGLKIYYHTVGYRPYTVEEAEDLVGSNVLWARTSYTVNEITQDGDVLLSWGERKEKLSLEEAVLLLTVGDETTPFGKKIF